MGRSTCNLIRGGGRPQGTCFCVCVLCGRIYFFWRFQRWGNVAAGCSLTAQNQMEADVRVTATLLVFFICFSSMCCTRPGEGLSPVSTGPRQAMRSCGLDSSKTRRICSALMTAVFSASQTLFLAESLTKPLVVSWGCFVAFCGLLLVALQIHADLALVPPATVCGKPNAVLVTLLRHALLQVGAERRVW